MANLSIYIPDHEFVMLSKALKEYAKKRCWKPSKAVVELLKENLLVHENQQKKEWIDSFYGACHFGMSPKKWNRFIKKSRSIEV